MNLAGIDAALAGVAGEPNAAEWDRAIRHAVDLMQRNLSGLVAKTYNVGNDDWDWVFGMDRWPRLIQKETGTRYSDDPLGARIEDVPLAEFLVYLRDWYWPRRRETAPPSSDLGIHLTAAREVSA